MRGVVEFFDERRGFGRVSPADGTTAVFCHFSNISDKEEQVLIPGEEVEFTREEGERGPVAREVRRVEQRFEGTVKSFDKGFGWISPADGSPEVFVHFSDITGAGYKRLESGEHVTYAAGTTDRGMKALRVRRLDTRPPLERFAALPAFDEKLEALAALAHDENWNYRHTKSHQTFPVLRSYVYYTFARLESEGKIAEAAGEKGRQLACINTGLATERQEAIFQLFVQISGASPNTPRWALESFNKESDRALTYFGQRPDLPNYFTEPNTRRGWIATPSGEQ